jgi:hypothetical protein
VINAGTGGPWLAFRRSPADKAGKPSAGFPKLNGRVRAIFAPCFHGSRRRKKVKLESRIVARPRLVGDEIRQSVSFARAEPALTARPPAGSGWLHEVKHDGFRVLALKQGERVKVWSRREADFTDRVCEDHRSGSPPVCGRGADRWRGGRAAGRTDGTTLGRL